MEEKRDHLLAFLTLLPSILLITLFVYGFIANTFYISLTDWQGLAEHPVRNFVGLRNYINLFSGFLDARFRQDLVNAVFYSIFLLGGSLSAGLFMAILLDRKPVGENIFRTIFLYPLSLSFIVTGTIWRWMLAPEGGINVLPTFAGLPKIGFQWTSSKTSILQFNWQYLPQIIVFFAGVSLLVVGWLISRKRNDNSPWPYVIPGIILTLLGLLGRPLFPAILAMEEPHGFNLATLGIIFAAIWQYAGYTMALYLAGLQSVSQDLAEAARLDGASEWEYYLYIAVPLLKPITISAVIILSHISLKMFDLIFAMTGPDNAAAGHPALLVYTRTFRANKFAEGAAIAVVLFLLAASFIVPYMISSYKERRV